MTELPSGWVEACLADVAEVRLGRQRSPKTHAGDNMRPYLRAANVTWGGLVLSDVKEMHFSEGEVDTYRLVSGDVLVAEASGSRGEVGKPALWNGEIEACCFQNTLLRVRSNAPMPKYLLYLLRLEALSGRLGDASRGVGIHHLGASGLSSYRVPLAPLAEEAKIVAAVEEQFSRLDEAEASLRAAARRQQACRASSVSRALAGDWPTKQLSDVTIEQVYGSSAKAAADQQGGVPIVRMGNIRGRRVDLSSHVKYLAADHPDVEKYALRQGDLLFNRTNSPELVGKSAVFDGAVGKACFASYLIRVRLDPSCLPEWAALYLNSPLGRRWAASVRTQQVGQANINGTKLAAMPLPIPPVEVQQGRLAELSRQVSILDELATAMDGALTRSKHLRRAILGRAFSGRLVPQDPDDEPAAVLLKRIENARRVPTSVKRLPRRRVGTVES